jgi:23S rRNA (cytosine1962-C5)-methyltransferase
MARLKIKIIRNLRKSILRGHPWVYKEAIEVPKNIPQAQLCQVSDTKGELGWAIYDPHGPLSLRMLSTGEAPPQAKYFETRFKNALSMRSSVRSESTNAFRLFNGEGDLLPGLVCDVYDKVAVLQFDGQGPGEFWDKTLITKWLLEHTGCKTVVEKARRSHESKTVQLLGGDLFENEIVIKENGALFKVNLEKGQKTGFFLDQRDNRGYVKTVSQNKSVLNLFSYSGGFSIYAGLGGASKVTSVDISKGAITLADENWALNNIKSEHEGLAVDVFEYLKTGKDKWDHIIVDPPSMSHSEDQKDLAKTKYIEVFSLAAKRVQPGGMLSLSSCSSHITFNDFFEIIDETLSQARRTGQVLKISGQGLDHPFPHACLELRYLKFVNLVLD